MVSHDSARRFHKVVYLGGHYQGVGEDSDLSELLLEEPREGRAVCAVSPAPCSSGAACLAVSA